MCVGVAETGVEHRSPAKKHKETFLLSYFCMTKSTKSHLRGLFPPVSATPTNALRALVNSPLLKNTLRVHELVARSSAWRVRAAQNKAKIGGFATLHGFIYTTRANISPEKTEQIRARIACTPAIMGRRA